MPLESGNHSVEAGLIAELGEVERVALAYAPARLRPAFGAVLALDCVLRRVALGVREPLLAQIKLAWWREALAELPKGRGHPLLTALVGMDSDALVALVDAWEEVALISNGMAPAAESVARRRSAALAQCAGEPEAVARDAARLWTLATLADHAPDAERETMRTTAGLIPSRLLPRRLRPLTVLEGLSRRALAAERAALLGDRWSPFAAMRLGIFGR